MVVNKNANRQTKSVYPHVQTEDKLIPTQESSDGFDLTFLSKVADIKDTVKKQTMVHHIACMMHENHPAQGDLHRVKYEM